MDLFTLAYIKNMTKGIHTEDCEGIPGKSAYEIAVENGTFEVLDKLVPFGRFCCMIFLKYASEDPRIGVMFL